MKFEETRRKEMQCEEAAEFISALCDGEMIPPAAAKHIGTCAACDSRLQEYIEMGAELRRVASLQTAEEGRLPVWERIQSVTPNWWEKGWETMRIPRFAVALLMAAVVVLGSSLAIVKVRAHTQGSVLMLTAKLAGGPTVHCALSLQDPDAAACGTVQQGTDGADLLGFRVISSQGDRVQLGVRARFIPKGSGPRNVSSDLIDGFPETAYWLQPGEKLEAKVEGSDAMIITTELLDHMPTSLSVGGDEQLEPNAMELRFVDPVLVADKQVACDFEGMTVLAKQNDQAIELHAPHDGRYLVSLSPLPGGVEGHIKDSRITFELNGQHYQILTGAPVARGEQLWILRLPNADGADEHAFVSSGPIAQYLSKMPAKN